MVAISHVASANMRPKRHKRVVRVMGFMMTPPGNVSGRRWEILAEGLPRDGA